MHHVQVSVPLLGASPPFPAHDCSGLTSMPSPFYLSECVQLVPPAIYLECRCLPAPNLFLAQILL